MTTPKIKTVSIAGDRWYIDPLTGDKVPGVSSVKDTLAKPGLLYGAVKVAANYAVDNVDTIKALALTDRDAAVDLVKRAHTRDWSKKADFGTGVHIIIEELLRGHKGVKVSPDQRKYVVQYAAFMQLFNVKALFVETTVWSSEHKYAGTLDTILELDLTPEQVAAIGAPAVGSGDNGRYVGIVDTKTGASGVWAETALQQVAYKNADYLLLANGKHIDMPAIDFTAALWLRPEGYSFLPLDSGQATWDAFIGLRDAYYWNKQVDSIGQPLNEGAIKKQWRPR